MKNAILSFAHRKLKHSPHYKRLSSSDTPLTSGQLVDQLPYAIDSTLLAEDEICIGFYENHLNEVKDGVLITDKGLHVRTNVDWIFIPYRDTASYEYKGGQKSYDNDNLEITSYGGKKFIIPILGKDEARGTQDVAAMIQFLLNAVDSERDMT